MNRAQYEANKSQMKTGGDFWNSAQVIRAAFRNPAVASLVSLPVITTGLWCDADVVLNDGTRTTLRLFA